jgi:hypothetical protein
MQRNESARPTATQVGDTVEGDAEISFKLSRWLVHFRSGDEWYSVGEYVAPSSERAIERAIDVLGNAAAYRADQIPWDAAPLSKWPLARDS